MCVFFIFASVCGIKKLGKTSARESAEHQQFGHIVRQRQLGVNRWGRKHDMWSGSVNDLLRSEDDLRLRDAGDLGVNRRAQTNLILGLVERANQVGVSAFDFAVAVSVTISALVPFGSVAVRVAAALHFAMRHRW